MRIITMILTVLLCFANNLALAAFDSQAANTALDKLSLQLSVVDVQADKLENAILQLKDLRKQAVDCENTAKSELVVIEKELLETQAGNDNTKKNSTVKFLQDKKVQAAGRRDECKLFVLRSSEAIDVFTQALDKFETTQRLRTTDALWTNINNSLDFYRHPMQAFKPEAFDKYFGLQVLQPYQLPALLSLLLITLVALLARFFLRKTLSKVELDRLTEKMGYLFVLIVSKHLWMLAVGTAALIAVGIFTLLGRSSIHLLYLFLAPLLCLFYFMTIEFFIYIKSFPEGLGFVPSTLAKSLARHLKIAGIIATVGAIGHLLTASQGFPDAVMLSLRSIFITFFALNINMILWDLTRVKWLFEAHRIIRFTIVSILIMAFSTLVVLEWIGYHSLTGFIWYALFSSFSATFITWIIYHSALSILNAINEVGQPWQNNIRRVLGISKNSVIPEMVWFRIVISLTLWGGLGLLLTRIWLLNQVEFDIMVNSLINGFTLSGFNVIPIRIIYAFFGLGFFSLMTRWCRRQVAIQTSSGTAKGVQSSMASLVGYIGFSISVLMALLIAGVNLSGLALVAGALSVGIGFGLQNIVNNFVSGIILLVERPIKVGDRVLVGEYEGHVKSISIRSTVIHSLDRTDVILPNSELISGKVVNLMLDDKRYRLRIFVGVAYGSDTELVYNILQDIAKQHPDVIHDETTEALILFNEFGDSSLNFELRVIIRDVNRRQRVRSELHYAIDAQFREHKIEIPFPQRDVWVKALPQ